MNTKTTVGKAKHIRHSDEYKQESLKLTAQIGVAKAAKQLGLHGSQLYTWRKQPVGRFRDSKTPGDFELLADCLTANPPYAI